MINTMEAGKKGSSIKRATEEYAVPRMTLQDHNLGNVEHGKKPGPEVARTIIYYLNVAEEEDMAKFVE